MKARPLVAALTAAAVVLAAGACGRGNDTRHAVAPTVTTFNTRAAYVSAADNVCGQANRRIKALVDQIRSSPNPDDTPKTLTEIDREAKSTLAELVALKPPAQDAAAIDQWIALQREALPLIDRLPAIAEQENAVAGLGVITQLKSLAQKATASVSGFGFSECGHGPTGAEF